MPRARNPWLITGGVLSLLAAALHLTVIGIGPDGYRFFGAGEQMARMAEAGHWYPAVVTTGIAMILAVWAAYAFSGAGALPRLPFLRTGLVLISLIYLARGLVLIPAMVLNPEGPAGITPFIWWSSLIVLGYGVAYALGTWIAWPRLSPGEISRARPFLRG